MDSREPVVDLIRNWCEANPEGWKKSFDTFAPGLEYRGTNFSLNVRSDFIVANLEQENGKWKQLIKPTPPGLWDELNTLIAAAKKREAK